MKIIGLTGSIGTGKSFAAHCFEANNIPVFDADHVTHDLLAKGGEAVEIVSRHFPECAVGGAIDRSKLRDVVVGDDEKIMVLESILHPMIADKRDIFFARCRGDNVPLVVWDSPLLFEKGLDNQCDIVIVTYVSQEIQDARVLKRNNFSKQQLSQIKKLQLPQEEKINRANITIDTSASKAETSERIKQIIGFLSGMRS
jgi:dephospho-CoA kinase